MERIQLRLTELWGAPTADALQVELRAYTGPPPVDSLDVNVSLLHDVVVLARIGANITAERVSQVSTSVFNTSITPQSEMGSLPLCAATHLSPPPEAPPLPLSPPIRPPLPAGYIDVAVSDEVRQSLGLTSGSIGGSTGYGGGGYASSSTDTGCDDCMRFFFTLETTLEEAVEKEEGLRTAIAEYLGVAVGEVSTNLLGGSVEVMVLVDFHAIRQNRYDVIGISSVFSFGRALTPESLTEILSKPLGNIAVTNVQTPTTGSGGGGGKLLPAFPPPPPGGCGDGEEFIRATKTCRDCPKGTYCKGGLLEECPADTYGTQPRGSDESTACKECPEHSTSLPRSTAVSDCVCTANHYFDNFLPEGERACIRCPLGADCTGVGTSLEYLPLKPGFWRWRKDVREVRACPGQQIGDNQMCVGNIGSTDKPFTSMSYCAAGLQGPYCSVCVQYADVTTPVFLVDTECIGCDESGSPVPLALIVVVVLMAVWYFLSWLCNQRRVLRDGHWIASRWHTLLAIIRRFSVKEQMRELLSFAQVPASIDHPQPTAWSWSAGRGC